MKKLFVALLILSIVACGEKSATEYIAAAKVSITQQKNDTAIIELKNAIKADPKQVEARFLLGQLYFDLHQYENAAKELERAIKYKHPKIDTLPLLARAYQRSQSDAALIALSLKGVNLTAAQLAEIKLHQVQSLLRLDEKNEAKAIIRSITALKTDSLFKQLSFAYQAFIYGNYSVAIELLDGVLKQEPNQVDALQLKAQVQLQNNDVNGAINTYRAFVKFYPEDITSALVFAHLLTHAAKYDEAEPIVDKLLLINTNHALLNQLKGTARYYAKDNENSLNFLEKSLLKNPEDIATRLMAGVNAYLIKDHNKVNQHLSFIVDKLPPSHNALRLLAASQLALGLTLEANQTVSLFDKITTEDSILVSNIVLSLAQQGEQVKAKALLEKSKQVSGNLNEISLQKVALLKVSLNDVSGIVDLEASLELEKNKVSEDINENNQHYSALEATLAIAYVSTGQLEKAIELSQRLKSEYPNEARGYILAGNALVKQQKIALAKVEFINALKLAPNNPGIKLTLITILPATTDIEKNNVKAALTELLKKHPDFVPAISRSFELNHQLGDVRQVIAHTEKVVKAKPDNVALVFALAQMYFTEKRYQDTITTLINIDDTANKPNVYWQLLGQSYTQIQDYSQAINTFETWLNLQPNNKEALLGNIQVLKAQNKFDEALLLSDRYIETQGQDVVINILRTGLLLSTNDITRARQHYDNLPEESLELPVIKGYLGQLQYHQGNYQQALTNLQLAYEQKPNPYNTRFVLFCLHQLKKIPQTLTFLIEHTAKNPEDIEAVMQLAWIQIGRDKKQAIINYQKVIALNDTIALAHNNLAFLLAEQVDTKTALIHAKKAIILMPDNISYLDTLGRILLDTNQPKLALESLSKAVNNHDKKPTEDIYLNYVEALVANNQFTLAKRKLMDYKFTKQAERRKEALLKVITSNLTNEA